VVQLLARAVVRPFALMLSGFSTAWDIVLMAMAIAEAETDPAKRKFLEQHHVKLLPVVRGARRPDPIRAAVLQREADEAKSAGNLRKAIRLYGRAIHQTPYNTALFFLRGNALLEANRPKDAAKDFVAGLRLDPGNQTLTFLMHTANAKAAEQALSAKILRTRGIQDA
jgi:tetratricopeptide (TPR) repeat protein